jgi:malonyl-ACP O-methyltransferase BioC
MIHSFKYIELYPNTGPPTLFLPGWGFDGRIVRLCKPSPDWLYPETLLDPETFKQDLLRFLISKNITKVRLVGWSMGAMLGLEFAAEHKDLIESLVLVSLRSRWPASEIKEIRAEFSRDPKAFIKGFYRKCFLGDKQTYRNFCTTLEPSYLAALETHKERLQKGLALLSTFKIPRPVPDVPTRLIHGRQDMIAPVKEMARLQGAEVEIIDTAGHFVFQHDDSTLKHEMKKQGIRVKFSRAAESYDSYAKVQIEVARRLAGKLPQEHNKPDIKTILEIGCGTGNYTSLLAARFPGAKIIALDFSPEMLAKALSKLQGKDIDFVCAEGERFLQEAPAETFDLVTSNGSLQWFADIDNALHNMARILKTGGAMSCSIFGPQSLKELGQGLQAMHSFAEIIAAQTFPQLERLQKALHSNFKEGKAEEELIEKEYSSAHDLLLHIKKTGTSGWQQNMQHPLTREGVCRLDEWFDKTFGACRVTYQILFLEGHN